MIKLILSILATCLYIANYWACELLYPGSDSDWAIFIPMDKLCHNFWAVIMLVQAGTSKLKTEYTITEYFTTLSIVLCVFDVWARSFGMTEYVAHWYFLSLTTSLIFSGIIYGISRRCGKLD